MTEIAVVDMHDFNQGTERQQALFAHAVGKSLEETGFVVIRNHGVQSELKKQLYAEGDRVFNLPEEQKRSCFVPKNGGLTGYLHIPADPENGINTRSVEMWHVGNGIRPGNVWPEGFPDFKEKMTTAYGQFEYCAMTVLKACSLYLHSDAETLPLLTERGWSTLRIMRYSETLTQGIQGKAHDDTSLLTVFSTGSADGLEVRLPDGKWLPIETDENEIVIGTGEMFRSLTQGRFRCGTHRVVSPRESGVRRLTLLYFVSPRPEVVLEPGLTTAKMLAENLGLGIGVV